MEFEIIIDFFLENIELFKNQFIILQLNSYELNFFIIKMNIINDYFNQDLRKSLIKIIFQKLKNSSYIENIIKYQIFITRNNNIKRKFHIKIK